MREKLRGPGRHSDNLKGLSKPKLEQKGAGAVNRPPRPVGASFEVDFGAYRPIAPDEKVDTDKIETINGMPSVPCRIYGPMSTGIVSNELWKRLQP